MPTRNRGDDVRDRSLQHDRGYRDSRGLFFIEGVRNFIEAVDHHFSVDTWLYSEMNWNNTHFDGKYPITIACARRVGQIVKYLEDGDPEPQTSYSFYM